MDNSLNEIAKQLKNNNKKVQLIYVFNGNGKTRLSHEFKSLIEAENNDDSEVFGKKILYYNAFTEDLFYWDNGSEPKFKIHPNSFTRWIFEEQGQDKDIIRNFQHYTDEKLMPYFNNTFNEVSFSYERGNNENRENIKISKGEESNLIWCVFYTLIEEVIGVLNIAEPSERTTNQFDQLEYVFIDDPVTSLDDNHLIQLAVDLGELIKKSESGLKFVITTHNPIFYNVIHNEVKRKNCYMLERHEDGTFELEEKSGDSNKSFSYHLHLKKILEEAIKNNKVEKYHFMLLRNLYEKTASFLGFDRWKMLLPHDQETYYSRIIQFTNHSTLADESVALPSPQEKETVKFLFRHLIDNYNYWKE